MQCTGNFLNFGKVVERTLNKILGNKLHCYPSKIRHVQKLFPFDLSERETFALHFLSLMYVDKDCPLKILWTGVAHFHLTDYAEYEQQKIHPKLNLFHFIL